LFITYNKFVSVLCCSMHWFWNLLCSIFICTSTCQMPLTFRYHQFDSSLLLVVNLHTKFEDCSFRRSRYMEEAHDFPTQTLRGDKVASVKVASVSQRWGNLTIPNFRSTCIPCRRPLIPEFVLDNCFVSEWNVSKSKISPNSTLGKLAPVTIRGGVGKISESERTSIIVARGRSITFLISSSISRPQSVKGNRNRKSRQNFSF